METNPYASPSAAQTHDLRIPRQLTFARILLLLGVGTLGGSALGTVLNCINGSVSAQYFNDHKLIWDNAGSIWLASVVQGTLEGAFDGFLYAVLFSVLIACLSERRCRLSTALRYALVAFALALAFWVLGGASGVVYVSLFPAGYPRRFFGSHSSWSSLACYAWVRGSYWGVTYGGGLAAVVASLWSALSCRRSLEARGRAT